MPSINYKGKRYKNMRVLAEAIGIPYERLAGRIKSGWPEERWEEEAGTVIGTSKQIIYKGKVYKTLKSLAEELGISPPTLRKQIRDNIPEEDWGKKERQYSEIEYFGKSYSLNQLAEKIGIASLLLRYRIQNWPIEDWDRRK